MRAVRFDQRLSVQSNQPKPVLQDDECLVRVHLAGIYSTDLQLIKGYMGFNGTLGHEFVGTVEDGPDQWKGKRVVGEINCVCRTCRMCQSGLSNHCPNRTVIGIVGRDGCFAEYLAIPVVNLHEVPSNLHDEQAVFTEPVAAALQILSQVHIDQRMQVAVVGPGRLGFLVAQVLKEHGCHLRVIGRNPEKLERCEKKGIQSFLVKDVKESDQCDVVVDCTGTPAGLDLSMSMTRPRGTLVLKST
ncbi:MAG: alcohol dehydrogenase catalytic domain-containing protein, partial [Phycisphaerae bacterium]